MRQLMARSPTWQKHAKSQINRKDVSLLPRSPVSLLAVGGCPAKHPELVKYIITGLFATLFELSDPPQKLACPGLPELIYSP